MARLNLHQTWQTQLVLDTQIVPLLLLLLLIIIIIVIIIFIDTDT